jgi:hypothetical protein
MPRNNGSLKCPLLGFCDPKDIEMPDDPIILIKQHRKLWGIWLRIRVELGMQK